MPPIFNRDNSNMDLTHHRKSPWGFTKEFDDSHLTARAKYIRDNFDYEYGNNIDEDS